MPKTERDQQEGCAKKRGRDPSRHECRASNCSGLDADQITNIGYDHFGGDTAEIGATRPNCADLKCVKKDFQHTRRVAVVVMRLVMETCGPRDGNEP